jgi:glycosyltransferase involved in cell wall biosynthesis
MKLSIIIPCYNERPYIEEVLRRVMRALPQVEKEIIVVDDGSTDGTREWLMETFGVTNPHPVLVAWTEETGWQVQSQLLEGTQGQQGGDGTGTIQPCTLRVIFHERNRGKGAALRTGFAAATGDVLVIQDADLEYDPRDWEEMWQLIADGYADVVYGSRFYGKPHRALYFHHYLGNKLISMLVNLLCDVTLSDIEVCYKMFRREVLEGLTLTCNDFGFEVEFTVKVAKPKRWRIYEVGIRYYGRTYAEGKKINWKDGLKALWYIVKFWLKE